MVTAIRPTSSPVMTLPGRYYHDPAIYAQEQERIFATHWICVGLANRIATPGSYFLATVAGESIIVLRDKTGAARAFYNVCRHRAARLCSEEQGQLRATIQCRYHAWTYGLDGRLVGAPYMQEDPSFDAAVYGLVPVHIQLWQGLVFLNLSKEPRPLSEQSDEVDHPRIGRYNLPGLQSAKTFVDDVRANWKLIVSNYEECAHCGPVHPELVALVPAFKAGLSLGSVTEGTELSDGVESLTLSGKSNRPHFPGLLPEDLHRYHGMVLWPNVFLDLYPDYATVVVLHPQGPDRTVITTDVLFDPETMARPDFDGSDAVEFTDLVDQQDWRVCELSQMGMGSRAFRDGGLYGPHERHIRVHDDRVLQLLGHN